MVRALSIAVLVVLMPACTTSPLGRKQLKLYSQQQMNQLGTESFDQIKQDTPRSTNAAEIAYVQCIADSIVAALEPGQGPGQWEVVVFQQPAANAFALPGGKIGVYSGLLGVAQNQDQLATVMGHEVGHVLAGHSNERMSQADLTQASLQVASNAVESYGLSTQQQQSIALLGVGARYGITLPYSRAHESEADLIGLDLMARAGFEPRESADLWRNMSAGGAQLPEILSTHPSHATRIAALEERTPSAEDLRAQARAAGRRPACVDPGR